MKSGCHEDKVFAGCHEDKIFVWSVVLVIETNCLGCSFASTQQILSASGFVRFFKQDVSRITGDTT